MLPRIVGLGRAAELLYTGRAISGSEAHAWGFYNELCAPERCRPRANELARELAQGPTLAHAMTETMLLAEWSMPLHDAIDAEARAQATLHGERRFPARLRGVRREAAAALRRQLMNAEALELAVLRRRASRVRRRARTLARAGRRRRRRARGRRELLARGCARSPKAAGCARPFPASTAGCAPISTLRTLCLARERLAYRSRARRLRLCDARPRQRADHALRQRRVETATTCRRSPMAAASRPLRSRSSKRAPTSPRLTTRARRDGRRVS